MNKYFICIFGGLALFAIGRYTAPDHIKIETKIVTVEKEVEKETHKTTVTVEKPDGTKETTVTDNSVVKTKTDSVSNSNLTDKILSKSTLNVSGLIGASYAPFNPVYGVMVTKSIVGPFTGGLWVTTGISGGISLGLNF